MRTICPGDGCREHSKKQKCRCGNSSVAAAFLWPDSEKALKSRAFGQNEKVGDFYQNYLPFVAERVGFEPTVGCPITSFQDWLLKPLGHLSGYRKTAETAVICGGVRGI